MSAKKIEGKVYYHYLERDMFLFADERDKWRFLEAARWLQQKRKWTVYAFCLTDSGAYFITESECITAVHEELGRITEYIRNTASHTINNLGETTPPLGSTIEELDTMPEIVRKCRQLHRIPLDLGYVSRIGDYWWSSYISYMGIYHWALVDCGPVSNYFSNDPEVARRMFRYCHYRSENNL